MKKLLIITGAGSSLEFGMPSMKEIDLLFEEWAKSIVALQSNSSESLYTWVKSNLRNYISQSPSNRVDALLNFESVLYTIQSLHDLFRDQRWESFNNRINPFIQLKDFPNILRFKKEGKANCDDFHFLHSYLVDHLLDHFRSKCKTLLTDKSKELSQLKMFFNTLKQNFDLGFINLNYDNVILSALPDLETGFEDKTGEFKRERIYNSAWNFCYHLHGSVHFDMRRDTNKEMHKIFWNNDLKSQFGQNSSGRSGKFTSEGSYHLSSNIITSLDKANQILREPFGTYFMQLDRLVYEADSVLFLGYGFNDMHINSIFPFIRNDNTKTRKVVVIDHASKNEDGLHFRYDDWTYGLGATLPYNSSEMGTGKRTLPQSASFLKKVIHLRSQLMQSIP